MFCCSCFHEHEQSLVAFSCSVWLQESKEPFGYSITSDAEDAAIEYSAHTETVFNAYNSMHPAPCSCRFGWAADRPDHRCLCYRHELHGQHGPQGTNHNVGDPAGWSTWHAEVCVGGCEEGSPGGWCLACDIPTGLISGDLSLYGWLKETHQVRHVQWGMPYTTSDHFISWKQTL